MTKADKALAACREYDRLMKAIAKNKSDIGDGLEHCTWWIIDIDGSRHIPNENDTHLSSAFEFHIDEYSGERAYLSEQEQLEIVGECEGCLKAWHAIKDRKANKKALGIIKRSIRLIGRSA